MSSLTVESHFVTKGPQASRSCLLGFELCAGCKAEGVHGVFETEGDYGVSAVAATTEGVYGVFAAQSVYGVPAVAAKADGVYGVFAAQGGYGVSAPLQRPRCC